MITIIVAVDLNNAIGRGGDMLYHLGADLRRFKALTMGHTLIMGRTTFDSLPKGALPGRRNIVVSRNTAFSAPGAERASSLEEAIAMAGDAEIFIIGGGQIYTQALPLADTIELTVISDRAEGADTFFPAIPEEEFERVSSVDAGTVPAAEFVTLRRRITPAEGGK